jgi:hypothetical protein
MQIHVQGHQIEVTPALHDTSPASSTGLRAISTT